MTETLYTSRQSNCTEDNILVSARPDIPSVGLIEINPSSGETTLRDLDGTCVKQRWDIRAMEDRQFSNHAKGCCEIALAGYREWVKVQNKPESFDLLKPFYDCMLNKSLVELDRATTSPVAFYVGLSESHNRSALRAKFRVKKPETHFYEFLSDLESCCDDLRQRESVAAKPTPSPSNLGGRAMEDDASIKEYVNTLRNCMINRKYEAEDVKIVTPKR
ncbi:MAG TPA: hypothetical protein VFG19_14910 [Geobacteraceae bacterium]|nr:hypothetical protein [Geobacteraceae bacterium]